MIKSPIEFHIEKSYDPDMGRFLLVRKYGGLQFIQYLFILNNLAILYLKVPIRLIEQQNSASLKTRV